MRALTWTLLALLGTAALAAGVPQNPGAPVPSESQAALEEWRARLSDEDLARREQAFEHLIQAVRQNPSLAGLLREWAADAAHPELAWTARLALRELGRAPAFAFPDFFQGPGPFQVPGSSGPARERPRRAADRGLGLRELPVLPGPGGRQHPGRDRDQRPARDQDLRRRVAAAILEANPELAKKLSTGRSALTGLRARERLAGPEPEPEASAAPLRTDVLGVRVREPTAAERGRAGLAQGGLVVDHVEEGTIADVVGLRPGAILVEINGHAIDSKEAISAALAERTPNGELRLTLFDAFGRRQTPTWRPAPAGPARSAGF